MPVNDGQSVNAAVTNAAFLDSTVDDTATGKITLANVEAVSGSSVTNIQREHNSIASFVGKALNAVKDFLPTYTNNQGFTANETLLDRIDALTAKFHSISGHSHDGTDGSGAPISSITTIFGSRGTPRNIDANGITDSLSHMIAGAGRQKIYVQGDGGAIDITANPQIQAGTIDGQEMILVGRSDTNTVLLEDGNGLSLNGSCLLGSNVTITLSWDTSVWVEVSRSL